MKQLMITLIFFVFSMSGFTQEISQEMKIKIDELLTLTGQSSTQAGKQFSDLFIQNMIQVMKEEYPEINPKTFEVIKDEVTKVINETFSKGNELNEMMYPIYVKFFSAEEIQQLIDFNKSELGQKLNQVLPKITHESMAAGEVLGRSLQPIIKQRIESRLLKEGLE